MWQPLCVPSLSAYHGTTKPIGVQITPAQNIAQRRCACFCTKHGGIDFMGTVVIGNYPNNG